MPRKTQAEKDRAVEERAQQRLAARTEAAKQGAATRKRNRELAAAAAEPQAQAGAQAAEGQPEQAPVAETQTKRTRRNVAQTGAAPDRGAMVTVALRGEQAERLRALATTHQLSLSKLLVAMMEVYEAKAA